MSMRHRFPEHHRLRPLVLRVAAAVGRICKGGDGGAAAALVHAPPLVKGKCPGGGKDANDKGATGNDATESGTARGATGRGRGDGDMGCGGRRRQTT